MVLKVIIESAALTDEAIVGACKAAVAAGADFVKTSTGFHPAGGASAHAVALMRKTVGPDIGVKASGGIRTADAALEMIAAGASRLGLSGTRAVLDGLDADVRRRLRRDRGRRRVLERSGRGASCCPWSARADVVKQLHSATDTCGRAALAESALATTRPVRS